MSNLWGMLIDDVIFSLLENRLRWMTKILGNLNMVIDLSIRSTALHLEHLYPHFSILSAAIKFSRQSGTLDEDLGI